MARYRSIRSSNGNEDSAQKSKPVRKNDQSEGQLYWKAPVAMIAAVLGGLASALAHHFFYHSFNGHRVESNLQQQVIVNTGTAFAFLVKMFFAIAVGIVFAQQVFKSLRQKAEKIEDIDSLFGVLDNALHFGKIALWFRHFMLGLLAAILWALAIPSVFTPGTINVHSALTYNHDVSFKPAQPQQHWINKQNWANTQLDFTALFRQGNLTMASLLLDGPSGLLYSVALGSGGRREVLPVPPPNPNSTYDLSFYAPALNCSELPASDLTTFHTALSAAKEARWLPSMQTIIGGVEYALNHSSYELRYNAWTKDTFDGYNLSNPYWNNDSSTFAENTAPNSPSADNTGYFYFTSAGDEALISCHLHNATYSVNFEFQNNVQSVDVRSVKLHEPVPFDDTISVDDPDYGNAVYTAVLWAFNKIVIAAAINETSAGAVDQGIIYYNNPVSLSVLRDVIENDKPLDASEIVHSLETMFQNITLSTMSAPELRLAPDQAKEITGSTWRSTNVYIYHPEDLFIAYGVSLLVTVLCVLWGLHLVVRQGNFSYSTKFSTFLRTTRREELNSVVSADATQGFDPVPRDLGDTKLVFGTGENSGDGGFRLARDGSVEEGEQKRVASSTDSPDGFTYQSQVPDVASDPVAGAGSEHRVRRKPTPHQEVSRIFG